MNKYNRANIDIHKKEAGAFNSIHPELFNATEYALLEKFYVYISGENNNQKKDILDLACGTGRLTKFFAQKGCSVTACDLSSDMLNALKINTSVDISQLITIHNSDVDSFLDNNTKLFDTIVMGAFLHHVHDIESLLIKVCKNVKSGGSILILHDPAKRRRCIRLPGWILEKIDSILFQIKYFITCCKLIPRSNKYGLADLHTKDGIDNELIGNYLCDNGFTIYENKLYFIHKTKLITYLDSRIFHMLPQFYLIATKR